uniref:C3H1-type domain-containing protein n=1 Tax=Opuntia streptacantha TaxID=393608 RepID=A0A7C9AAB0_OPUST
MSGATPKPDRENLKTLTVEIKHSVATNIPGQDSGASWGATSGGIGFTAPNTLLKLSNEALRDQALNNNHSATPNIPGQDSCVSSLSWSSASTLVVGEVHLPDVACDWSAFSIMHPKPGGEFKSGLVSGSSSKQAEVASEQATRAIGSCEVTHCSSNTPDCYTWQPIELSTLGDDSVSDLLSEVEAMESLRGMSSPTSRMDCGDDSIDSPRDNCFSLEGLNLNLDPGANDDLNSTADIQFPVHPTSVNQRQGTFPFHAVGNSGHEVKAEVKPAFSLMPKRNCVLDALPPAPSDRPQAAFLLDFHDLPSTTCTLSNSNPKAEGEMKETSFSLPAPDSISVPPPSAPIDQPQEQFRVDVNCLPSSTFACTDPSPQVQREVKSAIVSMPPSNPISDPPPPAPIDQPQGQFRVAVDGLPSSTCLHTNPSPGVEREVATVLMPLQISIAEPPPPTLPPPPLLPPLILPPPPPPKPLLLPPPEPSPHTKRLDLTSSPQEKGEAAPTSVLVPETFFQNHQPSPKTASPKAVGAETRKAVSETGSHGRGPPGQETQLSSSGSILGNPSTHRSTQGTSPGNRMIQNQTSPRYSHGGGRHSGPKDRSHHYQSVDSGFGKNRPNSWSRQSSFGGGGSSRPHSHSHSHRGQRVCKFYESGYCKKGASCKYWHP